MNEKILIIDDDPDVLETLDTILTQEGFQVKSALSGEDAIKSFKSFPFDLVITDIRMPGMGGLEVIMQIKKLDEDMEVIVLTGYATIENAIQALSDDRAFGYLTKPLENIDELDNAVNQALEKRRLRLENKKKTAELAKANRELRIEIAGRKRAEQALRHERDKLQGALDKVKTLSGLLPICSNCKKIRDDKGYWNQIEVYIRDHSEAEFSHSLCPECAKKLYPDLYKGD